MGRGRGVVGRESARIKNGRGREEECSQGRRGVLHLPRNVGPRDRRDAGALEQVQHLLGALAARQHDVVSPVAFGLRAAESQRRLEGLGLMIIETQRRAKASTIALPQAIIPHSNKIDHHMQKPRPLPPCNYAW